MLVKGQTIVSALNQTHTDMKQLNKLLKYNLI